MGGLMSTRWGGHARRRMIGEGVLTLDVPTMRRLEALGAGAGFAWSGVVLEGLLPRVDAVPAPFGGVRYWLRCPACDIRRRELYAMPPRGKLVPGSSWECRWRCRVCLRLAYRSQRLAPLERLQDQRTRLANRIAGQRVEWDGWPTRPKGRHRTRHIRELARLNALDHALNDLFITGATRLLERFNR